MATTQTAGERWFDELGRAEVGRVVYVVYADGVSRLVVRASHFDRPITVPATGTAGDTADMAAYDRWCRVGTAFPADDVVRAVCRLVGVTGDVTTRDGSDMVVL